MFAGVIVSVMIADMTGFGEGRRFVQGLSARGWVGSWVCLWA